MPGALTIDSDTTLTTAPALNVDEAATYPLVEIWVEFALTPQQIQREMDLATACILASRATNILAQAKDLLIFQGDAATLDPLFTQNRVRFRSGPAGTGLYHAVPDDPERVLTVTALPDGPLRFAERTYLRVTEGCARLKSRGHYGPYVLVLHTFPYADTYAPLATTPMTPGEMLEPLVTAGFYETGTLPPMSGLLISIGGNSMDLTVGQERLTTYLQEDAEGKYRFRVWERFALRLKAPTAILRLDFVTPAS